MPLIMETQSSEEQVEQLFSSFEKHVKEVRQHIRQHYAKQNAMPWLATGDETAHHSTGGEDDAAESRGETEAAPSALMAENESESRNVGLWERFLDKYYPLTDPTDSLGHAVPSMGKPSVSKLTNLKSNVSIRCNLHGLAPYLGPDRVANNAESRTVYINSAQFPIIMARRKLRVDGKISTSTSRKPYLHESRHKHACKRKRGPGGRFLTREEMKKLQEQEKEQQEAVPVQRK